MNPISLMLYGIPKFAVATLLSHCAGGISTASGDMEPSTTSLSFYRITASSIPRYRGQCFVHRRQSRILRLFLWSASASAMQDHSHTEGREELSIPREFGAAVSHVISRSCREAMCLLSAGTDVAAPCDRSLIYATM